MNSQFYYHRSNGTAFPQSVCKLRIDLFSVIGNDRDSLCSLPFYVDGTTMTTFISGGRDSVVVHLLPGNYKLEYTGFVECTDYAEESDGGEDEGEEDPDIEGQQLYSVLSGIEPLSMSDVDMLPYSSISLTVSCGAQDADADNPCSSAAHNYVVSITSRDGTLDYDTRLETVDWIDDLGRIHSQHLVQASPSRKTLVTLNEYDAMGRIAKTWLPAPVYTGWTDSDPIEDSMMRDRFIDSDILKAASRESHSGDQASFSLNIYDPLNRVRRAYGPGSDWYDANRCNGTDYLANTYMGDLDCKFINLDTEGYADTTVVLRSLGSYLPESLEVVRRTDEQGRVEYCFNDNFGRMILQRKDASTPGSETYLDTYYVYDALDHLTAVIPPALSVMLTTSPLPQAEVDKYAYLYKYDVRERLCAKKLPGAGWNRMAYDDADRMIFSQDAEQRSRGESTFYLYDIFGRQCVTGICDRNISLGETISGTVVTSYIGSEGLFDGYDTGGLELSNARVVRANYYDSYDFLSDFHTGLPNTDALYGAPIERHNGLQTGGCAHIVDGTVGESRVFSLVRYDHRGRSAHKETAYEGGGVETEDTEYDFIGAPLRNTLTHKYSQSSTPIEENILFDYDHAGRPVAMRHSLDGTDTVLVASHVYDEFGRIIRTERNAVSELATEYTYNIRSWVKSISGTLFQETLYYNDDPSAEKCYDGSLSSMTWKAAFCNPQYSRYQYDRIGRLISATNVDDLQYEGGNSTTYQYDLMGNIVSLCNLVMTYDGNHLVSVEDTTPANSPNSYDFRDGVHTIVEYEYDRNGRMMSDLNRGVSRILYNFLGLPYRIEADSVDVAMRYLPSGTKLSQQTTTTEDTVTVEYRGNIVWKNGEPAYLLFDGGYVDLSGTPEYMFYIKDHLGSNRVVADGNGTPRQVNHYYPYGGSYSLASGGLVPSTGPGADQPWRFAGKELAVNSTISLYDFGARPYDPFIGRFLTMDPMAEKFYAISPYAYCLGNPFKYVDEDGESPHIPAFALIGAGVGALTALCKGEDAKGVLNAAVMGAIDGALAACGGEVINLITKNITKQLAKGVTEFVANVLIDAMTSAGESSLEQILTNGEIRLSQTLNDASDGAGVSLFCNLGIAPLKALIPNSPSSVKSFTKNKKNQEDIQSLSNFVKKLDEEPKYLVEKIVNDQIMHYE